MASEKPLEHRCREYGAEEAEVETRQREREAMEIILGGKLTQKHNFLLFLSFLAILQYEICNVVVPVEVMKRILDRLGKKERRNLRATNRSFESLVSTSFLPLPLHASMVEKMLEFGSKYSSKVEEVIVPISPGLKFAEEFKGVRKLHFSNPNAWYFNTIKSGQFPNLKKVSFQESKEISVEGVSGAEAFLGFAKEMEKSDFEEGKKDDKQSGLNREMEEEEEGNSKSTTAEAVAEEKSALEDGKRGEEEEEEEKEGEKKQERERGAQMTDEEVRLKKKKDKATRVNVAQLAWAENEAAGMQKVLVIEKRQPCAVVHEKGEVFPQEIEEVVIYGSGDINSSVERPVVESLLEHLKKLHTLEVWSARQHPEVFVKLGSNLRRLRLMGGLMSSSLSYAMHHILNTATQLEELTLTSAALATYNSADHFDAFSRLSFSHPLLQKLRLRHSFTKPLKLGFPNLTRLTLEGAQHQFVFLSKCPLLHKLSLQASPSVVANIFLSAPPSLTSANIVLITGMAPQSASDFSLLQQKGRAAINSALGAATAYADSIASLSSLGAGDTSEMGVEGALVKEGADPSSHLSPLAPSRSSLAIRSSIDDMDIKSHKNHGEKESDSKEKEVDPKESDPKESDPKEKELSSSSSSSAATGDKSISSPPQSSPSHSLYHHPQPNRYTYDSGDSSGEGSNSDRETTGGKVPSTTNSQQQQQQQQQRRNRHRSVPRPYQHNIILHHQQQHHHHHQRDRHASLTPLEDVNIARRASLMLQGEMRGGNDVIGSKRPPIISGGRSVSPSPTYLQEAEISLVIDSPTLKKLDLRVETCKNSYPKVREMKVWANQLETLTFQILPSAEAPRDVVLQCASLTTLSTSLHQVLVPELLPNFGRFPKLSNLFVTLQDEEVLRLAPSISPYLSWNLESVRELGLSNVSMWTEMGLKAKFLHTLLLENMHTVPRFLLDDLDMHLPCLTHLEIKGPENEEENEEEDEDENPEEANKAAGTTNQSHHHSANRSALQRSRRDQAPVSSLDIEQDAKHNQMNDEEEDDVDWHGDNDEDDDEEEERGLLRQSRRLRSLSRLAQPSSSSYSSSSAPDRNPYFLQEDYRRMCPSAPVSIKSKSLLSLVFSVELPHHPILDLPNLRHLIYLQTETTRDLNMHTLLRGSPKLEKAYIASPSLTACHISAPSLIRLKCVFGFVQPTWSFNTPHLERLKLFCVKEAHSSRLRLTITHATCPDLKHVTLCGIALDSHSYNRLPQSTLVEEMEISAKLD